MIFGIPTMELLHAGCAAAYFVLALLILFYQKPSRTGLWLALACLVMAGWAFAVALAWRDPFEGLPDWFSLARSIVWYGFILHLYRRTVTQNRQLTQTFVTMGLLALFFITVMPLLDYLLARPAFSLWSFGVAARLGFAVGNILLIENLYFNTPADNRWHINLLCVALGGVFLYDLVLFSDALLFERMSVPLFQGRASVDMLAVPLIAMAVLRNPRWSVDIQVSRAVVFHSATLIVSGLFLLGLSATGEIFRRGGAEWGFVAEITLISGGILAIAVMLTSGSARSRLRGLLVDNFLRHRYDYRQEWMRCITTLSASESHIGLQTRAIRAVAEVVDSPAGLLFVRDPEGTAFQWGGSWNMPAATMPVLADHPLLTHFRDGDWVVDLTSLDSAERPGDLPQAWLAVPLNHLGLLIGFVVVARPRASFRLDREVYELLRIVGREVAIHVAAQRAVEVLAETKHLREYSKRFAFVIHDIKNVSGQLSMLLTNAEVHADNPEFQRDMLSTVRASVARITRLLTKVQAREKELGHSLIVPVARLAEIAETFLQTRGVRIDVHHDGRSAGVAIDAEAFDAVVTHLLNNAIEAADGRGGIELRIGHEALSVVIDVVDRGSGMSPEFVRDELFRPFTSTKRGGHGIGVFQARELLREAGGDLLVMTRPGEGTTMRMLLPSVRVAVTESAALSA
jgi:putative PEP-CTERM system histidine kinase